MYIYIDSSSSDFGECFRSVWYGKDGILLSYIAEKTNGDLVQKSGISAGYIEKYFVPGYEVDSSGACTLSPVPLSVEDENFLLGLTANLLGFTMVFLVGFLFVLQGRR